MKRDEIGDFFSMMETEEDVEMVLEELVDYIYEANQVDEGQLNESLTALRYALKTLPIRRRKRASK